MKNKLFRLGVTVAMLAVLVESLGAPMKWGSRQPPIRNSFDEGSSLSLATTATTLALLVQVLDAGRKWG